MKRRSFIAALGGAAAWPLVAHSQPGAAHDRVLVLGSPPPEAFLKGLRDALRDAGYIEGRSIRLDIRSAEGRADLLAEKAAELVRLNVAIITAYQTPAATAASGQRARFPSRSQAWPIRSGPVLSRKYARPGGNITGVAAGSTEVAGKTVELIREALPSADSVAVLANETDPFAKPFLAAIGIGARAAGLEVSPSWFGRQNRWTRRSRAWRPRE